MKLTISKLLTGVVLLFTLSSCEKDLPLYDYPDNMLNFELSFDPTTKELLEKSFSFVYADDEVVQDTFWIRVNTMGFLSKEKRYFELQQVPSNLTDAVVGVHYKSFDDADLKAMYYIAPDSVSALVPVVVLRDASLAQGDVHLHFTLKPNENFQVGYAKLSRFELAISNKLSKPSTWDDYNMGYYIGTYGPVLHKFMIEVTGLKWDDQVTKEFLDSDGGYVQYIAQLCDRKLTEENERRAALGLEVLCEDDGTPVEFPYGHYYNN